MYELTQRDTVLSVSAERPFNRYTLAYTADVPLCGTLVYEIDGAECRAEDFFLEAGENAFFSSYINSFLSRGIACRAVRLKLRTISHERGSFTLLDFSTELAEIPAEKTYYMENPRYRVGIELCWGGGLSYLADKAYGDVNIDLPYQVPEARYFLMGDNRAISVDSRTTTVGCVAEEQIVGKIVFRVWPLPVFGEL